MHAFTRGTQEGFSEEVTTKTRRLRAVRGRGRGSWPQVSHLTRGRASPHMGACARARVGSPPSLYPQGSTLLSGPTPQSKGKVSDPLAQSPASLATFCHIPPQNLLFPSDFKHLMTHQVLGVTETVSRMQGQRTDFPPRGIVGQRSSYSWFFLFFFFSHFKIMHTNCRKFGEKIQITHNFTIQK